MSDHIKPWISDAESLDKPAISGVSRPEDSKIGSVKEDTPKVSQASEIEYAARHTRQLSMTSDSESSERISFLVGVKGTIQGEERSLLLHISDDGSMWQWKDTR